MFKTLYELYYGKLNTWEPHVERIPGYREAEEKRRKVRKELEKRLNDTERELFDTYTDLQVETECHYGAADFLHGFCMGVRLMAEIFCEKE